MVDRPGTAQGGSFGSRPIGQERCERSGGEASGRDSPVSRARENRGIQAQSVPRSDGGQKDTTALPMIHSRGTGPQKRLSSELPRLSPIRK